MPHHCVTNKTEKATPGGRIEHRFSFKCEFRYQAKSVVNFPVSLSTCPNFPKPSSAAAAAATSLQSCPTLCDPLDCSPPGFSVHGISQARILEQVAISSSRGPFWPRDRTCSSCIGRWILYQWATWEAYHYYCSKMIDKILSWIEFQNVLFRKSKFLGSKITAY